VTWRNTIGLTRVNKLAAFITGAEDRQKICRSRNVSSTLNGWLPGFQYDYTDYSSDEDYKFCASSHPHPNLTGSVFHLDPDFQVTCSRN
jgi:hypothetical protein